MSDSAPSPETVIDRALRRALAGVHTIRVGYIESYDASRGEAFVQPADMAPYRNEQGVRIPYQRKPVPHVPVFFPGGGGTRDTWPVKRGDACILLHCSVPIGRWLVNGGIVDEQNDTQRHDLGNSIALVGISDFGHFQPASSNARVVGEGAALVALGGLDDLESVLLGNTVVQELTTLITAIGTAVGSVPGASAAITTALNNFLAASSDFLSPKVKVSR